MSKKTVAALINIKEVLKSIENSLFTIQRYKRPATGKCNDCIYWDQEESSPTVGKCRESNPIYADFPIRKHDEWCGDFWSKEW